MQHNLMNVKLNKDPMEIKDSATGTIHYNLSCIYFDRYGEKSTPLFIDFTVYNEKLFNKIKYLKKNRYISIVFEIKQRTKKEDKTQVDFNNYIFRAYDLEYLDLPQKKELEDVDTTSPPVEVEPYINNVGLEQVF